MTSVGCAWVTRGGLSGGASWPCRSVFWAVWSPFTWLVGYRDPRKPDLDILHGERPQAACRSVQYHYQRISWALFCTLPLIEIQIHCS